MRRSLSDDRKEFDPRKFLKQATAAAQEICKLRFEAFGSAGRAAKIRPLSMEKMAASYRSSQRVEQIA